MCDCPSNCDERRVEQHAGAPSRAVTSPTEIQRAGRTTVLLATPTP